MLCSLQLVAKPDGTFEPAVPTLLVKGHTAEHACGGRGKVQAGMMPASTSAPDVDELHLGSSVHSGPPARSSSDRVSAGCRGQSANQQGSVAWARMPWHATALGLKESVLHFQYQLLGIQTHSSCVCEHAVARGLPSYRRRTCTALTRQQSPQVQKSKNRFHSKDKNRTLLPEKKPQP